MRFFRALAVCAVVAVPISLLAAATPAGATSTSKTTGTVKGVIKNASTGKPIAGVCVNVVEASDNTTVGTSAASNSSGDWTLKGVPPATDYTAISVNCNGTEYVGQWYDHKNYQNKATEFAVTAGSVTSGINFSLSEGGNISGTVTDSTTSEPVEDVLVVALWTTQDSASTYATCTSTAGTYELTAVPTSGAIVWFDTGADQGACGATTSYDSEYYLNSSTYSSATVVAVKAGKTTKNIDQALTASSGS